MTTTTIRLPDELKAGVAAAAERAGKSPHAYILEAIAEKVEQEGRRAAFDDEAERRFAEIVASGRTIPWSEMRSYLEARLAGTRVQRPTAKKRGR